MESRDLKSIQVFQAVLRDGSATRAAERLGMTQPAVTKAIAALEARTGLTLFERGRFGMRPTAEGALLAEQVRRSFAGLDRIKQAAEAIRLGLKGRFHIAGLLFYAEGLLPRAIGALAAEAPGLQVKIEAVSREGIYRRLLEDSIDMGVVMGPFPPHAQFAIEPLAHRRLAVIMGAEHRLANRPSLDVPDLEDVEMVMLDSDNPYRAAVRELFEARGIPIRSRLDVVSQRGAIAMALAGELVTIVDQEIAEETAFRNPAARAIPFAPAPSREMAAVHRRDKPLSLVGQAVLHRLKLAARDFAAEAG